MTKTHELKQPGRAPAGWEWTLADAHAVRVAPTAQARWLVLGAGTLWLTRTAAEGETVPDAWLAAGDRLLLPAGSEWVAEARGAVRFELLEPPAAGGGAGAVVAALLVQGWRGLSRAVGDWTRRLSLAAGACRVA